MNQYILLESQKSLEIETNKINLKFAEDDEEDVEEEVDGIDEEEDDA